MASEIEEQNWIFKFNLIIVANVLENKDIDICVIRKTKFLL